MWLTYKHTCIVNAKWLQCTNNRHTYIHTHKLMYVRTFVQFAFKKNLHHLIVGSRESARAQCWLRERDWVWERECHKWQAIFCSCCYWCIGGRESNRNCALELKTVWANTTKKKTCIYFLLLFSKHRCKTKLIINA